jgi:hypothetical protein
MAISKNEYGVSKHYEKTNKFYSECCWGQAKLPKEVKT